ncbi:MAG: sensor domain-containing diguanylate cyclase, partial [Elusimicrobia bacterium]|nr:sensor domain-containing diguanylate cyclase [Elusimicrobiota bacterium]
ARYTQLRAFTDELAASLQIKDVQTMVGSSLLKLFGGEKDAQASLHLFDSPNNPAKDDAVGQWLTKYRIPLWIQDFSQDQRFFQDPADRRGSLLSAPIERENGVIGSLILESPQTRLWDEEDRRFLADISSLVSLSVSNAVYYEKVESLAVKDALTGLYARYRFDEKIEEEFFRSRKSGSPLSLIFFDIDLFKRVNDSWGHNVGDEVLKSVAAFVMGQTRETDFCARYGGEEIVVLMPLTTLGNASQIADRIRQKVAAHPIGFEQIPVTISGGVSSLTASMDTPLSLLQSADQSLYKAKGSGRNRIVTS